MDEAEERLTLVVEPGGEVIDGHAACPLQDPWSRRRIAEPHPEPERDPQRPQPSSPDGAGRSSS